ncbi:MAG: lytic transglycosylase domain-containing protein [Treponema sp.]|nr:lytic transglycosylase domain-containing protein [Treponema sp.]
MIIEPQDSSSFSTTARGSLILSGLLLVISLTIAVFLPASEKQNTDISGQENFTPVKAATQTALEISFTADSLETNTSQLYSINESRNYLREILESDRTVSGDIGLDLYRNPQTKAAVELFYFRFTGNRKIALTIIEAANRENIPLPLAFALCHTESRFKATAKNTNTNGSVDRGLFQLNDKSFPHLEEDDFFAPETSARYGMKHLAWCRKQADDDLVAVAMYNAGVARIKANQTPKSTLIYVSKIAKYKASVEQQFKKDVLEYLNDQTTPEWEKKQLSEF